MLKRIFILLSLVTALSPLLFAADIYVYPNPWVPDDTRIARQGGGADGTLTKGMTFANLSGSGEISIYSVSSSLVRVMRYDNPSKGKMLWNGKNDDGNDAASGVYLWKAVTSDGTLAKTGKIIVLR